MTGLNTEQLCGLNKKPVPRQSAVPELAQLYALGVYREWFRTRYPIGEVISEWDLVGNVSVGTGDRSIDTVLKWIKKDFRNYYSKSDKNRLRIKQGVPASGLREGRSVRADGLGVAYDPIQKAVIAELLEVTTADEAPDTIIEDLQPKLALLRGPIKTLAERELEELRSNVSSEIPSRFLAYGSPWIIPAPLALVPIFGDTPYGPAEQYRWLCFAPTYEYRPFPFGGFFGSASEPEAAPARGLIAYSYHAASVPAPVPKDVVDRFKAWLAGQQKRYQRLELLPLPELTRYWQDNRADLALMLAYLGAVTVAIATVALAIYLAPIVLGAAAGALTALSGVAASETLALNAGIAIAAVSTSVPQLMNLARTATQSIASFNPQLAP